MNVKEVAAAVGIDDPAYFSRMFHKECGCWPVEYRQRQTVIQNVDGEFYPFVKRL